MSFYIYQKYFLLLAALEYINTLPIYAPCLQAHVKSIMLTFLVITLAMVIIISLLGITSNLFLLQITIPGSFMLISQSKWYLTISSSLLCHIDIAQEGEKIRKSWCNWKSEGGKMDKIGSIWIWKIHAIRGQGGFTIASCWYQSSYSMCLHMECFTTAHGDSLSLIRQVN